MKSSLVIGLFKAVAVFLFLLDVGADYSDLFNDIDRLLRLTVRIFFFLACEIMLFRIA